MSYDEVIKLDDDNDDEQDVDDVKIIGLDDKDGDEQDVGDVKMVGLDDGIKGVKNSITGAPGQEIYSILCFSRGCTYSIC